MIEELLKIKGVDENTKFSDIEKFLQIGKDMDKTTVYRNLESLEESGLLTREIDGDNIIYLVNGHHKHHLTCTKCHKSVEIECPFDNQKNLNGFEITNHYLNLEGVCSTCQKK